MSEVGLIFILGFLVYVGFGLLYAEKKKRKEDRIENAKRFQELKEKTGYDEDKERLKDLKIDLKEAIANSKKKTHTKTIDGHKEIYVQINKNYFESLETIHEDIKELKKEIKELEKEIKSKDV
jgi:hypothetical protein